MIFERGKKFKTPTSGLDSELDVTLMRNILFSLLGALVMLAAFGSCSTTVKTDSGHGVTTGIHTR
jgi:hypothetical protein